MSASDFKRYANETRREDDQYGHGFTGNAGWLWSQMERQWYRPRGHGNHSKRGR